MFSRFCWGASRQQRQPLIVATRGKKGKKKTNAILRDSVEKLGVAGQEVAVSKGFMRNYLYPKGYAIYATDENKEKYKSEESVAQGTAKNKGILGMLEGRLVAIERRLAKDQEGALAVNVTPADVSREIKAQLGLKVRHQDVYLPGGFSLKQTGEVEALVSMASLGCDSTARVRVNVVEYQRKHFPSSGDGGEGVGSHASSSE
ncbi:unnamed protein product [Chrysoparadoxa australica]